MRIALCDDHEILLNQLHTLIIKYSVTTKQDYKIHQFLRPSELYTFMEKEPIDLIFMDLEFANCKEDGIEWSTKIKKQFPTTLIIILTAYESRYKEGYIARAFRFMTKPIHEKELFENLSACKQEFLLLKPLNIQRRGISHEICMQDVLYLSAQFGGCELWTASNLFFCDESLLHFEETLPCDIFFRCHKKYLVNLTKITEFDNHSCTLTSGEKLPISRRRWRDFQIAYMKCDTLGYRR